MHRNKRLRVCNGLLDHLVGAGEQRGRDLDADDLGRLQVDNEFELGRPQHRQIGRPLALKKASGINACGSPGRFGTSSRLIEVTPVTLPPGRLRLATRPALTGSEPILNTIGIDVVAAFAANAPSELTSVAIT